MLWAVSHCCSTAAAWAVGCSFIRAKRLQAAIVLLPAALLCGIVAYAMDRMSLLRWCGLVELALFTGGWGGLAGERKSRQRYLAGFVAGPGVKSPAGPNWRQRPHSDRNGRTERFPCCAWNVGWHLCRALSVFSRSELAGSCSVRLCVHGAN